METLSSLTSDATFESNDADARQRLSTRKLRCFISLSGVPSLMILVGLRSKSFSAEMRDATAADEGTRSVVIGSDDL